MYVSNSIEYENYKQLFPIAMVLGLQFPLDVLGEPFIEYDL